MWVILTCLLSLAVWWDFKTHRIPNKLILLGMCLGSIFSILPNGVGWLNALLGWSVGLVVFMPFYLLRVLGAGDVKLLATVGAFMGYPAVLLVALFSCLAGGFLSILIALHQRQLIQMSRNLYQGLMLFCLQITSGRKTSQWSMTTSQKRLPYALAIALGTLYYAFVHGNF